MDSKVNTRMDESLRPHYAQMYSPGMKQLPTIGDRLDWAMKKAGIPSQSALQRASGIPQATISRILKGDGAKGPEAGTLRKLAAACNVSFEWLNDGVGEPGRTTKLESVKTQPSPDYMAAKLSQLVTSYILADDVGRRSIDAAAMAADQARTIADQTKGRR